MPTITNLLVDGNATSPREWSSQDFGAIDEAVGTAGQDNDWIESSVGAVQTTSFTLQSVPSDFGTMDSLSITIRYGCNAAGDDTGESIAVRIVNGATVLAAADSGGGFQTLVANVTVTTFTNLGPTAFTHVNTTADKATWDGAQLEIRRGHVQNMGNDNRLIDISALDFDGVYTASAPPPNSGSVDPPATVTLAGSATGEHVSKGSITGTVATAGSTTGEHVAEGSVTGGVTAAGSATGTAPVVATNSGSVTGTVTAAGTVTGSRRSAGWAPAPPVDVIDGGDTATPPTDIYDAGDTATPPTDIVDPEAVGVVITGTATGAQPSGVSQGAATGIVAFAGMATGEHVSEGFTIGAVAFAGTAVGEHISEGASTGQVAVSGTATGEHVSEGATTGTVATAGSATGSSPTVGVNDGFATGTVTLAGSVTGSRISIGAITGQLAAVGTATGSAPAVGGVSGSAVGTVTITGQATGARKPAGITTGTLAATGTATGTRISVGAVTGTVNVDGSALGFSGELPIPSGRPVTVTRKHKITVDRNHRITVHKGLHLVEA